MRRTADSSFALRVALGAAAGLLLGAAQRSFAQSSDVPPPPRLDRDKATSHTPERTKVFHGDGWIECARYDAEADKVVGPAVIEGYTATTWVPPGWTATLDAADNLILRRSA